jgi:peptide/nickel transport system substrate-binding protein
MKLFYLFFSSTVFALNVAWENFPRTIDPRFTTDANSHYLADLIHCGLIGFDEGGQIVGSLAKEWRWFNATTVEFKLHTDRRFSSGSLVTPQDIEATYRFFLDPTIKKPSPLKGAYEQIKDIKTTKDTITFVLKEADQSFLQNFSMGILPAAEAKKESTESFQPGCGPYVLESKNIADLVLKANPHYHKTFVNKHIRIFISPDEQTRFSKLVKGEVDLVQNGISRDKVRLIARKYPRLKIDSKPGLRTTYLGVNFNHPLLRDRSLRQAIAHSIQRELIIDKLLAGMAQKANGILVPGDPFVDTTLGQYDYDLAKAKSLLKKPTKEPLRLSLKTTTNITTISIAQAIASQLKPLGIDIKVEALEWGRLSEDVQNGRVDLYLLNWVGFKDPDIYRHAFFSTLTPPKGANRGFYQNAGLDSVLLQAQQETVFDKRRSLYQQAHRMVFEDLPYIFLWHEHHYVVHRTGLTGYKIFADGRYSSLTDVEFK